MKTLSLLALFTAVGMASTLAMADEATPLKGCAAKQHDIETQLEQARAHGNNHQQKGLRSKSAKPTCRPLRRRAIRTRLPSVRQS